MSGWMRFVRYRQVSLSLRGCSGDWAAVWASVSSLGFCGRFRCPRWQRSSEDLFSKAMHLRKDFDTKLSVGAGLFDTELMLREVVPA